MWRFCNAKSQGSRKGRTDGRWRVRCLQSEDQSVANFAIETAGGRFGGQVGALAADVIEPAIASCHRGPAHSCVAGVAILSLLGDALPQLETFFPSPSRPKSGAMPNCADEAGI